MFVGGCKHLELCHTTLYDGVCVRGEIMTESCKMLLVLLLHSAHCKITMLSIVKQWRARFVTVSRLWWLAVGRCGDVGSSAVWFICGLDQLIGLTQQTIGSSLQPVPYMYHAPLTHTALSHG